MKKIILTILVSFLLLSGISTIYGMTYYEETDFVTGIVTASALNVRCGPRKEL